MLAFGYVTALFVVVVFEVLPPEARHTVKPPSSILAFFMPVMRSTQTTQPALPQSPPSP